MNNERVPGPFNVLFDAVTGFVSALRQNGGAEQPVPQFGGGQNNKNSVGITLAESDWGTCQYLVAQAADKTFTVPAGLPPGWWCLVVYRNNNSAAGRLKIANDGTSIIEWNNAGTFAQTSPVFASAAATTIAAVLIVHQNKPQDSFFLLPIGGGTLSTT